MLLLREQSGRLWGIAFVITGIAAFTGGTFHGFAQQLSAPAESTLWKITVYAIGLSSMLLLWGAIEKSIHSSLKIWLIAAAVLQFAVYAYWMRTNNDFRYVIYDYAPAMIGVLLIFLFVRQPASPWVIGGILLSFGAAAIQQTGIQFYKYFNHNDLYHVIQMVAMWLLYRGGALLHQ